MPLGSIAGKVLLHGHCHQKSFGAFKRSNNCCG